MNKVISTIIFGCLIPATAVGLSTSAQGQDGMAQPPKPAPTVRPTRSEPVPKPSPSLDPGKYEVPPPKPEIWMIGGNTSERSISVTPNVTVTLCVVQGKLKINGWARNEVRVFVKDGSQTKFHVRDKSPKDDKPIWVSAIGYDPKKVNKSYPDCLWGDSIEIDVPNGASVEVKGQEIEAQVDSIKRVWIKNVGGDISIRNVSSGVTAITYEGDVVVQASEGPMVLETTSGNVTAFEVSPGEIGDRFKANTASGAISLQSVGHRQTEVNSISGSVFFSGDIRPGGSYGLSTANGSIRMALPPKSAFQLIATYGYGTFSNELPFKVETENISDGPIKRVVAKVNGGGDATVKLSTNHGTVAIKKN